MIVVFQALRKKRSLIEFSRRGKDRATDEMEWRQETFSSKRINFSRRRAALAVRRAIFRVFIAARLWTGLGSTTAINHADTT